MLSKRKHMEIYLVPEKNNKAESTTKQIDVYFERDPLFRVMPSNNAMVGLGPNDTVRIDFYVESVAIPEKVTHVLTEDKLGPEIERTPPRHIMRSAQASVIMPNANAAGLARILVKLLESLEKKNK